MKRSEDPLPTRATLLRRIQNEAEATNWQKGWEEFFSLYRPLIFGVARQSGLHAEEAADLVMEVMAELRRRIASYELNPKRGPFKAWLLKLVRWRIKDKLRARHPLTEVTTEALEVAANAEAGPAPFSDETWEQAWRERLLEAAIERVRAQADPRQFQIFNACTTQKIRAQKVAESFGVSLGQVYLAKHRVGKLVKREAKRVESEMERSDHL
jgi:RNA polymerase sigma factor (sigma-70 family)